MITDALPTASHILDLGLAALVCYMSIHYKGKIVNPTQCRLKVYIKNIEQVNVKNMHMIIIK